MSLLLAFAPAPAADDPETRFALEQVDHGDDEAFELFIDQLVEDAVLADEALLRDALEQEWHGSEDIVEALLDQPADDSVEFLLDALPQHDVELEEGFDQWLDQVVEDAAAAADDAELLALMPEQFDDGVDGDGGIYEYELLTNTDTEVVSEWIARARRRGRRG